MTRNRISLNQSNQAMGSPSRGVVRFDGGLQAASQGTSVPQLQPIRFTPGGQYLEQMNAIANLGEGIFNATTKVMVASQKAKENERAAYLSDIETDDILETNRIYNENKLQGNNPEQLALKLEQYRNGKMSSMPQEIQPYYQENFDVRAASLGVRSQNEFYNKAEQEAKIAKKANLEIIKDDIFKNPVPITEIDNKLYQNKITSYKVLQQSRIDSRDITPEEAILEEKSFRKDIITQAYKSHLDSQPNADARAQEILKLYKSKNLPEGLNESDKADIVARLNAYDATVNTIEAKAAIARQTEQKLNIAREASDLEIRVNRDTASYEDVLDAERKGIITPDKKVSLIAKLDNNLKDASKKAADIQRVADVLSGQGFLDPKASSDDFKAVDLYYENEFKRILSQAESPDEVSTKLTGFVEKTGVVPSELRGKMRGVFRGGSVDDKVFYADLVGRIQEVKPRALDDFDDKDIAQAVMIDEMVKAGTPNEQAIELVTNQLSSINNSRLEVLKTDLDSRYKEIGNRQEQNTRILGDITDEFSSPGGFIPFISFDAASPSDSPVSMSSHVISEYRGLYEKWYLATNGNADIAKKQAMDSLKRNWGTTSVNGISNQLTKYPIENQYPGMTSEQIKTELLEDLRSIGFSELEGDKVYIQADNITARQAGKGATYIIQYENKDGILEQVSSDDGEFRWKPDYETWYKKYGASLANQKTEISSKVEGERSARPLSDQELVDQLEPAF